MTARFIFCVLLFNLSVLAEPPKVEIRKVYVDLESEKPAAMASPEDGTGRLFVLDQLGKIFILPKNQKKGKSAKVFLDISDRILKKRKNEEGLLGFAFHPRYKENRKFYIYYVQQGPKRSVISEILASKHNASKADLSTETILMEISQPFPNHNSGNLIFGEDGYLYIGVGDGGNKNDKSRYSQNTWRWNGKILRIDVDAKEKGLEYGIPRTNPFRDQKEFRPEIYALGLRNPWGMYFDKLTGIFWCADVGQNVWEEINHIENGGNYGWSFREGDEKFAMRFDEPADELKFIDPIYTYGRNKGLSITGGVIYYGKKIPDLAGHYLYADYVTGTIWALDYDAEKEQVMTNHLIYRREPAQIEFKPTAFGYDQDGEILILSWSGDIYEMLPAE